MVNCNVIHDLLPLYVENLASDDTIWLIDEHLKSCQKCTLEFGRLKTPSKLQRTDKSADASLLYLKKELRKRKLTVVCLVTLAVFWVMVIIFARLTEPVYYAYTKNLIQISESTDGTVYGIFDNKVTAYRTHVYRDEEYGMEIMTITAWSTTWDRIIGKGIQSIVLSSPKTKVDAIYYCANEENAFALYGSNPYEGMIELPHLALKLYLFVAVVMSVFLGIIWLLVRKRPKAGRVAGFICLAPFSYLIGDIGIKGFHHATFTILPDIVMILIATAATYGILVLGVRFTNQHKDETTP